MDFLKITMNIRNIGIFAHINAGKTTLAERILYASGRIQYPGSIQEGTTESDFHQDEIERGISVYNSVFQFEYKFHKKKYAINLIDTPGHLDFGSQVESALHAVDVAILIIDSGSGIQSQTEIIFRGLQRAGIPVFLFINKVDKYSEQLEKTIADIANMANKRIIRLLNMDTSAMHRSIKQSATMNSFISSLEDEEKIKALEWDNELSAKYLTNPQSLDELAMFGLQAGFKAVKLYPILWGSALNGIGVSALINWICLLEPGVIVKHDSIGVIFKKIVYNHKEKYYLIKSYTEIRRDDKIFVRNTPITIKQMQKSFGSDLDSIEFIPKYSVGAVAFPGDFRTGEFLALTGNRGEEYLPDLDQKHFGIVIEPDNISAKENLIATLDLMVWEDDGLKWNFADDSGSITLRGRGELHLEIALSRLKKIFPGKFNTGKLKVVRYERLKILDKNVSFMHSVHGGDRESGELIVSLEKLDDFKVETVFAIDLPDPIQNSIKTAFTEVMSHGLSGREITAVRLKVHSYEPPEIQDEDTFKLVKVAVISGLKKLMQGNTELIGPVSILEILLPTEDIGVITSELLKRKARISGIESHNELVTLIKAESAAENLLGFAAELRNMTQGRGFLYMNTLFQKENFAII